MLDLNKQKGFTLMEMVVTLGVISILLAGTVFSFRDFGGSNSLSQDRDGLLGYLFEARTLALSNFNQSPHGVYISSSSFTLFEGDSYATREEEKDKILERVVEANTEGDIEFVFEPLTAETASASVSMSSAGFSVFIYINQYGAINW